MIKRWPKLGNQHWMKQGVEQPYANIIVNRPEARHGFASRIQ
jgi:hypothetical protein